MMRIDELINYLIAVARERCGQGLANEMFLISFSPSIWTVAQPRAALLTGLATLEVALPAAAEGAVAATAVDDGLAADEEVGDAL